MRRCQAPSQVARREEGGGGTATPPVKRRCGGRVEEERAPLAAVQARAPIIASCAPLASLSPHEALIRSLLNKPFRVPLPGYTGGGARSLGVRRSGARRALHDPTEEGALVLHLPPALTAEERLRVNPLTAEVEVVVDPLLSRLVVIMLNIVGYLSFMVVGFAS